MGCTDSEMVVASQIARMDFDPALLADGGCSVGDIIEEEKKHADKERKKELEKLEARLKETPGAENSRNWIIRDVCNDQRGSGMYACLLETSPGEAVLAFRCSESDTPESIMKDWVLSDLGLLNHMLTPQQWAAEAYTQEVYRKYGNSFATFSFSGHSLGGNLAEHAAITAPATMREKIGICRNLDGPGFSGAYLTAHAGEIAETAARIRHDRWSLVGNLLNAVPGTRTETVTAVTPMMGNPLKSFLWRHDTQTLIYDKNGNFVSGVQDPLARGLSPLSRKLDFSMFVFSPGRMVLSSQTNRLRERWKSAEIVEDFADPKSFPVSAGSDAQTAADTGAVRRNLEKAEDLVPKILRLAAEAEAASVRIPYSAAEAGEGKRQVCRCAELLEKDGRALKGWASRGRMICQGYEEAERQAGVLAANLPSGRPLTAKR